MSQDGSGFRLEDPGFKQENPGLSLDDSGSTHDDSGFSQDDNNSVMMTHDSVTMTQDSVRMTQVSVRKPELSRVVRWDRNNELSLSLKWMRLLQAYRPAQRAERWSTAARPKKHAPPRQERSRVSKPLGPFRFHPSPLCATRGSLPDGNRLPLTKLASTLRPERCRRAQGYSAHKKQPPP